MRQYSNFKITIALPTMLVFSFATMAQNGDGKIYGRPDFPGVFLVEFGFLRPLNASDDFNTGFWGSRSVNIYYQYPFRIGASNSRLAFVPGIGLGMDRFKFRNNRTLGRADGNELVMTETSFVINKSQLITNYLDAPIEFQFTANPSDPSRSFKASVGLRAGFRIAGFTKVIYREENEKVKEKIRRDWNLSRYRYGIYGKVGIGHFSAFVYNNISTLFTKGDAPGDDINTYSMGAALQF
jgi:hypothetical protein